MKSITLKHRNKLLFKCVQKKSGFIELTRLQEYDSEDFDWDVRDDEGYKVRLK